MSWLLGPHTRTPAGYGNPFNRPLNFVRDEYGNLIGATYDPTPRQIAAMGGAAYSGPSATLVREPRPMPAVLAPAPPPPKRIIKTRQDRKRWERYRRTNRGLGDGEADLPRFVPTLTTATRNAPGDGPLSNTEIAILAVGFGLLLFVGGK
jgi:hypothetical protein